MNSDADGTFIKRRGSLIRIWRYVGTAALLVIVGFSCYLFVFNPLLINPFHVMKLIEADAIPDSTLMVMAAMMPVVFLAVMFIMAVSVLFVFAAFSNERRLLEIIRKLRSNQGPDS